MSLSALQFLQYCALLPRTQFSQVLVAIRGLKDNSQPSVHALLSVLQEFLGDTTPHFIAYIEANYPILSPHDVQQYYTAHAAPTETDAKGDNLPSVPTYNVFVNGLAPHASDDDLRAGFAACGQIHSAATIKEKGSGRSKGFGFVNFLSPEGRDMALANKNGIRVCGQPIKCFISDNKCQLFVANLPRGVTQERLMEEMSAAGCPCVSVELKKGFAFVTYVNVFEAESAMKKLRGRVIDGTALAVEVAGKKEGPDGQPVRRGGGFSKTLYVNGLAQSVTDATLKDKFSSFGPVVYATCTRGKDGAHRGYGFVQYTESSHALSARDTLHNTEFEGQKLGVFESKPKEEARRSPSPSRGGFPRFHFPGFDDPRGGRDSRDSRGRGRDPYAAAFDPYHLAGMAGLPSYLRDPYGPGAAAASALRPAAGLGALAPSLSASAASKPAAGAPQAAGAAGADYYAQAQDAYYAAYAAQYAAAYDPNAAAAAAAAAYGPYRGAQAAGAGRDSGASAARYKPY